MRFTVGDRILFIEGDTIKHKGEIVKIEEDKYFIKWDSDGFIEEIRVKLLEVTKDNKINNKYFDFDVEWYRNEKINNLLI